MHNSSALSAHPCSRCGRDVRLWTCDDCRAAYQRWVCAASFRRCNGTDPKVVMPNCDDICWATVRQCPATQQFSCPNNVRKLVDCLFVP